MNLDKKVNAMVDLFYKEHINGETLKSVLRQMFFVGSAYAICAMHDKSEIINLQAARDVIKEMEDLK